MAQQLLCWIDIIRVRNRKLFARYRLHQAVFTPFDILSFCLFGFFFLWKPIDARSERCVAYLILPVAHMPQQASLLSPRDSSATWVTGFFVRVLN